MIKTSQKFSFEEIEGIFKTKYTMSAPQAPHVIAGVDVTPVFGQASGMQLREEVKIHDTPRTNSNAHSFFVFNFLQNVIFFGRLYFALCAQALPRHSLTSAFSSVAY